jgi:hypothetical protein
LKSLALQPRRHLRWSGILYGSYLTPKEWLYDFLAKRGRKWADTVLAANFDRGYKIHLRLTIIWVPATTPILLAIATKAKIMTPQSSLASSIQMPLRLVL